jgi:hypothetical protein
MLSKSRYKWVWYNSLCKKGQGEGRESRSHEGVQKEKHEGFLGAGHVKVLNLWKCVIFVHETTTRICSCYSPTSRSQVQLTAQWDKWHLQHALQPLSSPAWSPQELEASASGINGSHRISCLKFHHLNIFNKLTLTFLVCFTFRLNAIEILDASRMVQRGQPCWKVQAGRSLGSSSHLPPCYPGQRESRLTVDCACPKARHGDACL